MLLIFSVLEAWLGQTGKVKAGSVWALILNFVGKILRKKGDLIKSKEYNTMVYEQKMAKRKLNLKKSVHVLILAFVISGMGIAANAQTAPWKGFWKPVTPLVFDNGLQSAGEDLGETTSAWLFRPQVSISAMKFTPSDVEGQVYDVSAFTSAGFGVGYQHFVPVNGKAYNQYGFNVLMLFEAIPAETTKSGISIAGCVNALQYVNAGVGYDFTRKSYFLLMGITYSF